MSPTKIRVPEAPADLKEKRSQWQRAAEAGDSEAMNSLGILYSQWAETPDLEAGRRWYERGADAGNSNACLISSARDG